MSESNSGANGPYRGPFLRGYVMPGDPFNMGYVNDRTVPAPAPESAHQRPLRPAVGIGSIIGFALIGLALSLLMCAWFGLIG